MSLFGGENVIYKNDAINTMQKYLSVLRKLNKWTTENLGNRIGVTKQTISNLENAKVTMTKTQYIALRCVFENEVRKATTCRTLKRLFFLFFYSDIEITDEEHNQLLLVSESIAAASINGISNTQLDLMGTTLLSSLKCFMISNEINFSNNEPFIWLDNNTMEALNANNQN